MRNESRPAPAAMHATDVEQTTGTIYPEPFRAPVLSRAKRALGNAFGLTNFGVNLVELPPGAWSAQRHWHTLEDEFVIVLDGELTLVTDAGRTIMTAGMIAGFPKGVPDGHHLVNESGRSASFLVVGDRRPLDEAEYPDVDLRYALDGAGGHHFVHKDGRPYEQ